MEGLQASPEQRLFSIGFFLKNWRPARLEWLAIPPGRTLPIQYRYSTVENLCVGGKQPVSLRQLIFSRPMAFFVFLSAAAGAGIIAADLVVGTVNGSRCRHRLVAAVQGEFGLWT